jgi:hypothetical protein
MLPDSGFGVQLLSIEEVALPYRSSATGLVGTAGRKIWGRVTSLALTGGHDRLDLDPPRRKVATDFLSGRGWHPSGQAKRRHLLALLLSRGHDTFVESGTYRGDTVAYLASYARRIVSVELDPTLFEAARKRFESHPGVEIRCGDALEEIPKVVGTLDSPPLVWLDGHFSGGGTASGEEPEPAAAILARLGPVAPVGSTIVVDDLRLFGMPEYVGLYELIYSARTAFPNARIRAGLDSLVIEL